MDSLAQANRLLRQGQADQAIQQLMIICRTQADNYQALLLLSEAFEQVGAIEDVTTTLEYSAKRFQHAHIRYRLAQHYIHIGRINEAIKLLHGLTKEVDIKLRAYAYLDLARHSKTFRNTKSAALISRFCAAHQHDKTVQMVSHYALSLIFDYLQNYPQAAQHVKRANQLQFSMCHFRSADMLPFFASIKHHYNQAKIAQIKTLQEHATPEPITPIFIVGLPRSGSTLLEQMLAQHTDIQSVGESTFMPERSANYLAHLHSCSYPEFASKVTAKDLAHAAQIYRHAVHATGITSPYVIDKMPANFQSIGLIFELFPQAKVIHLQRHFADTALSILQNHFAVNEPYLCSATELLIYKNAYQDLMAHWQTHFADRIINVQYETLVQDPEQTMRQILTQCSINWQPECLDTANKNSWVSTLSASQVRQPIHSSSIGKSQHYFAFIPELDSQEKPTPGLDNL